MSTAAMERDRASGRAREASTGMGGRAAGGGGRGKRDGGGGAVPSVSMLAVYELDPRN